MAYGGVMPLYAILIRQYFGAGIMGATFGAATLASTLGMAIGPLMGGWIFDRFSSSHWLYVVSFVIGLGAVAIAFTFRPPESSSSSALKIKVAARDALTAQPSGSAISNCRRIVVWAPLRPAWHD
jgi:MFS family permease